MNTIYLQKNNNQTELTYSDDLTLQDIEDILNNKCNKEISIVHLPDKDNK